MPALCVAVVLLFLGSSAALSAGQPVATPRVTELTVLDAGGERALVLSAPMPGAAWRVGLVSVCRGGQPQILVMLGAFPQVSAALQLAVRLPSGEVERFGPVFRANSSAGFHSPEIVEPPEINRFFAAAFVPGALVSNGYNSFFNDASPEAARRFRDNLAGCAG